MSRVEWDETKNMANQRKHGVSFGFAARVFLDEHCLFDQDRVDDETAEMRWHAIGRAPIVPGREIILLVVHVYREDFTFTERITMAKKSSASSQPARLVSKTFEDIKNRKLSDKERRTLLAIAERQAAGDDSQINYDDIPPLTDEQWAGMIRFRDRKAKVPVSFRIDATVLAWLKSKGEGHLTRINDILTNVMEAEQRSARRG
jgi:uncharacterized DUF497 family protein